MRTSRGVAALVGLAALLAAAAPAAAAPRVSAYPGLYPHFSASVTDYVSRCQSGRPLILAVHAPRTAVVTVGSGKPSPGNARERLRLAAGAGVTVKVRSGHRTSTYHVRCLPKDFPQWTAERHGTPQAKWYLVTPAEGGTGSHYVALFDRNGVPVWWMRTAGKPMDAKLLPDGRFAWSFYTDSNYAAYSVPYEEHRLDGSLVRKIKTVGTETDGHELQVMPNGNRLLVSYVPRDHVDLSPYGGPADASVVDSVVQEVSPAGKLVWSWNSKDHVSLDESRPFMSAILSQPITRSDGRTVYDITHVNSVEPYGKSVLISLRHTDGVYKVRRSTGAIVWKLGGTSTPASLTVPGGLGGPLTFSGQHDARVLTDGTVTVHDNRTGSGLPARAVRFRIDEADRTATQVEQLIDHKSSISFCCGSARKLPAGDWVMSWGSNHLVTELTPAGRRRFALTFDGVLFSYRAVPILPGELTSSALRAGMDAMHP